MAKMRATSKMPRGLLARYRTRMLTAGEPDAFDEPSLKWSRFYTQHGWATPVPEAPAAPLAPRRGRPPKSAVAAPEPEPEPVPASEPESRDPTFDDMTVADIRAAAELRGFSLEPRYYRRDELIAMLKGG